jgi:hypothetical protein
MTETLKYINELLKEAGVVSWLNSDFLSGS